MEQQLQGSEVAPYALANMIAFLFKVHGLLLESVRLKGIVNNVSHCMLITIPPCTLSDFGKPPQKRLAHALHNCPLKGLGIR